MSDDLRLEALTHLSLSVTDLERSLAFYRDVLGLRVFAEPYDGTVFEGREAMVLVGSTAICLQAHTANAGSSFDPTRTGLDHLAFQVATTEQLEDWAQRLTAHGVEHAGVRPLPGFGSFIELRDPDGIQLELHCLAD